MSNARCYKTCQCDAGTLPGTDPNRCASVNVRGGCRWVPVIHPNARSFETDGVVTKKSAIAILGAITLRKEQMQMRNDWNLRDVPNLFSDVNTSLNF